MTQVFHLVENPKATSPQERWFDRRPLPADCNYDPSKYFGPWEHRQFLEQSRLGPFGFVTVTDLKLAQIILRHGLEVNGKTWHATPASYVRDESSSLLMVPDAQAAEQVFDLLGLHLKPKEWADCYKITKYLKRLNAAHLSMTHAEVRSYKQTGHVGELIAQLPDGLRLRVKYDSGHGVLTDGMHLIQLKLARRLFGRRVRVGDGFMITVLSPLGFSKGHVLVVDDLNYDLVLFESKPQLIGDRLSFGVLGRLHPGPLFTDVQTVLNFALEKFLLGMAETHMREVFEVMDDEERLRNMLGFYRVGFHVDEDGQTAISDNDWVITRALRAGIKLSDKPGLRRRIEATLLRKVMDCESSIRVPVPGSIGFRRYALVDPTVFNCEGEPVLKGTLRDDQVYVGNDVSGSVFFHRQPNAHQNECGFGHAVSSERLAELDSGVFAFMSRDMLAEWLSAMGGGDQDDAVCIYRQPEIVEHVRQLVRENPYPIDKPERKPVPQLPENRFADLLPRPAPVYDADTIEIMLNQQERHRMSIGQTVNPIMLDTIITREKENILDQLVMMESDAKVDQALRELENFEGYRLRTVASRLEEIIDSVKKDGRDISDIQEQIKAFWAWLPVVPEFCLRGGFGNQGRLPSSRQPEDLRPVVIQTGVDKAVREIRQARVEFEDVLARMEWQAVAEVPMEIQTYPTSDVALPLARAIKSYYNMQLRMVMDDESMKDAQRKKAFHDAQKRVYLAFCNHPLIVDGMVALWDLVYSQREFEAPVGEDGRPKHFPDGVLWGHHMSQLTFRALDAAELTGRYMPVEFYPGTRKYRFDTLDVRISNTVVSIAGTEVNLGTLRVTDGQARLERGLVRVRTFEAQPKSSPMQLTVVNGWSTREHTEADIREWKSHVHEQVSLVPTTYEGPQGPEYAVRVMLGEREFGWLARELAHNVLKPTTGFLAHGETPKTLSVVLNA